MALTVLSGSMGELDDERYRIRQGFWLRAAREAKGMNQLGAARLIGLSTKSAISDYESGRTQVPMDKLRRLAREYGWPLVIFTEPEPTAAEQAQERIARLARATIRVADQLTAGEAEAAGLDGDAPPGDAPTRRSA